MADMKQFEHLKIQLDAIKLATNDFADESFIGRGGFGKVYKGKIANFGGHTVVALKRLDRRFGQGDVEFWKEIMMLSLYKHENIVSLLGFCDDSGEKILVYEYVSNKSLDYYLNNDNIRWIGRLKICIGAARGLAYLHSAVGTQQRVLHRDIKSSNILLDENWNAKISDFGLSKFGPANQEYTFLISNAVGTLGYCDPLYATTGLLTKESDVYSFGVVLFEVLCGRFCIDNKNERHPFLIELAQKSCKENTIDEIVYDKIKDEINPKSLQEFVKIAFQCLKRDRKERPLMSDVVGALEIALHYQEHINDQDANTYSLPKLPSELEVSESEHGKVTRPIDVEDYASNGGFLVVTIHEGNDITGKRPFVILRVGHDIRQTKTIKYNQNPVWNEAFTFAVAKPAKATLHLTVTTTNSWGRKEPLGYVDISVGDIVQEKHMNNIYNVRDGRINSGRIHVELQWESSALPVETKPKLLQFMSSVYHLAAGS